MALGSRKRAKEQLSTSKKKIQNHRGGKRTELFQYQTSQPIDVTCHHPKEEKRKKELTLQDKKEGRKEKKNNCQRKKIPRTTISPNLTTKKKQKTSKDGPIPNQIERKYALVPV